jgi:hypothetical protein
MTKTKLMNIFLGEFGRNHNSLRQKIYVIKSTLRAVKDTLSDTNAVGT